jgi:dTDP-4-amino-4,6-dideoxygalactose transaminase
MIGHSASHLLASDFDYIRGIIDRNHVGQGLLCEELKHQLKSRFGCREVVLADSGTAALYLCLIALREERRGRTNVLVGAYCCPEVISAVIRAELEPVLADTREDSLNVDMAALGKLIDARTLAVICTNVGGMPDDYAAAGTFGVPLLSDCAQAIGSSVAGRDVASEGICSILSFGPTKVITAGGGGAVLCRSDTLAESIRNLARPELSVEEYHQNGFRVTCGQHMGDLTAGLAGAQMRRLEALVDRRRAIAESYDRVLSGHGDAHVVREGDRVRSNRFRYYFLSDRAPRWIDHMRSLGIDARGSISHVIPSYHQGLTAFPRLARASSMVVSVPIFPAMSDAQVRTVTHALASGPE